MDCNQLEHLVGDRSLEGLTPDQRERVEAHLVECATCRQRWDAACQSAALHTATKPDRDPGRIRDNVMARIRGDAEGRPLPEQIGGFEVLGIVARGGMGTVLKARQVSMDRVVALKILPPRVADDEAFVSRFIREAHAAAKLRHPHIVQGYDAGLADGYYYFAMEYVDGEGLDAIVGREGPLEPERALRVMRQVCSALWAAHKAGIIHRDIKPSNLMLDSQGEVRVTDFGLAKRTEGDVPAEATEPEQPRGDLPPAQSQALGTPAYVAPEVAQGKPADPRSDLYSLGATFFHLLAGRAPFEGPNLADVLQKQIHEQPPPLADAAPHVDPRLCAIIDRLLRKDPEERFPSAQAVLAELDALGSLRSARELARAEGRAMIQDAPTMPLTAGQQLEGEAALEAHRPRWVMSRRRVALVAAAVAAACMLVVLLWPRHQESPTTARRVDVRPSPTPDEPAVDPREQQAADLFRDAGDLALMMQWLDAKALVKRLDEGYSDTAFYKEQIVPIGKLRARINAALETPAVEPPAPVEAKPIKLPEKPGEWASLFDGKTLNGWRVAEGGEFEGHGSVRVEAGHIVVTGGRNRSGIAWMGDFPTVDYEVSLEARREAGTELVEILFPVGPTLCGWTVAGWGGTFTGLAMLEGHGGLDNDTRKPVNCRTGQWYRTRLRVTGEKIEGWLDDAKYIDLPRAGRRLSQPFWLPLSDPFALTTWRSTLAVRNIRLKLLEGQPAEAPADAAEVETASVAVAARGQWFDTGLFLTKGKTYEFTATGRWAAHTSWDDGPAGAPRKQNHSYPLIGPRVFDLIAHVGEEGGPFHVGERLKLITQRTGRLYLRMNDDGIPDNWGSLHVRIHGPLRAVEGAPLIARFTETVAKLKVGPADGWVDSGLSLRRGDRVLISAEGTWIGGPQGEPIDANGYRQTWRRERAGALVGRIGQYGALFTAARLHLLEASEPGKLYLAINEVSPLKPRGVIEEVLRIPGERMLLRREGGDPAPRVRGSITVTIRAPDGFREGARKPEEPPDLYCRLLATLRGHRSEVTCVAFSPDGAQIASASKDRMLHLWDAKTGKSLKTMQGHMGAVEAVAFSPDGTQLVSASEDRTVRLWDAAAGHPLRVLAGHTDAVWSVAFFPDGKRAASTGRDRSVRIWDVARGECLVTLQVHSPSWCVAVPPGGGDVAAINERGWIRIWDAGSGDPKRVIFARSGRCRCLAYSSDGKRLASAGDRPYLHVWDAATGKCLGSVDLEGGTRSLVFSRDGRYLATGSARGIVRLWDAATLEHLRSLQGHATEVRDVAFSPDGRRLATASFDGTIKLWALENSAPPDPEADADEAPEAPVPRPPEAPRPKAPVPGPADDPED